jgi:hypothetical protein
MAVLSLVSALVAGCVALPESVPDVPFVPEQPVHTAPRIEPSPTFPPVWTATVTPTPTPTITPIPTDTPVGPTSTPLPPTPTRQLLQIYHKIVSRRCTSGDRYLISFWIWAEGGDHQYTYYRDIDKIGGPTSEGIAYELEWQACGGAVGTFFAQDESGEKTHRFFWADPPSCCEK